MTFSHVIFGKIYRLFKIQGCKNIIVYRKDDSTYSSTQGVDNGHCRKLIIYRVNWRRLIKLPLTAGTMCRVLRHSTDFYLIQIIVLPACNGGSHSPSLANLFILR
jgi:hypothetical protein